MARFARPRFPDSERDKRAARKPVNACDGNVSGVTRSCDAVALLCSCRRIVRDLHAARTQISFCMYAAHERHLFFAFVGDNESRYRDNKKIEQ